MFKKILVSMIISLLIISTNVSATELPETEEDVKNIGIEIMNQVFSKSFFDTFKENYNKYFSVYYTNLYECFKEIVYPKVQTFLSEITSSEEYQKEKEELKEDFPSFWEKITNLFKK